MQEMAEQSGAVYEVDDAGNKTGVWMPVDNFHNMLEMLADAAVKMGMLEALFEASEEDDECEDPECSQEHDEDEDDLEEDEEDELEEDEEEEEEQPLGRRKR